MAENTPSMENIVRAANEDGNNRRAGEPLTNIRQVAGIPVASDEQTRALGGTPGLETNAVMGRVAQTLHERRNKITGRVDINNLRPDEIRGLEIGMDIARARDSAQAREKEEKQASRHGRNRSSREIESDLPGDKAAPPGIGTLSYVEPGKFYSVPLYGRDPENEAKLAVRTSLKSAAGNSKPVSKEEMEELMKVNLTLPGMGDYRINAFDYKPTLEAYLISRGAPISRKGTSVDAFDRARQYAQGKLSKPLPDDEKYTELDTKAQQLLTQLDRAWKSKNHELFVTTLDRIKIVTQERSQTQRGLYKSIDEGLDWRKDLITKQSTRTRDYLQYHEQFLTEAQEEFGSISSQDLYKKLHDYLRIKPLIESAEFDTKARLLAKTLVKMRDLGKAMGDQEIQNIALMYIKGFKESRYHVKESKLVSSLHLSGLLAQEEGNYAQVFPVENETQRVTLFNIGPEFSNDSDIGRMLTLAHELQHWTDIDTLRIPGLQGTTSTAFGVSTEAAAHLYSLKIYQKLKKFLNQSSPRMEEYARLIQFGGVDSILTYGLDYVNSRRKQKNNAA